MTVATTAVLILRIIAFPLDGSGYCEQSDRSMHWSEATKQRTVVSNESVQGVGWNSL
jgi:hypothetical protein